MSVPSSGASATMNSSGNPTAPGFTSQLNDVGKVTPDCQLFSQAMIPLMSNGAFQPPRNRTTVSAERTNTLMYSAKKKNPKRMPEYSVAKPATISESASVRSNGVRLPSAVAAMKKMRKP